MDAALRRGWVHNLERLAARRHKQRTVGRTARKPK
jgi:hypothetical protein